jgi:hypothetical protein
MIAPYFPPRARVGAERPFKLARYLPRYGFTPLIAHLRDPHAAGTSRPGLADMERIALWAPFDREAKPRAAGAGRRARSRVSEAIDRRIPIDSWWPILVLHAGRVLRAARAAGVSAVWSTADPWSSHALGMRVARALRVPWIADFRDPWSLCGVRGSDRPAWVRNIDAHVERAYLEAASAVTFTARRTTQRYQAAYPELMARFHTLENAFDPTPLTSPCAPGPSGSPERALSICFFGRFRRLSSAAAIIDVLAALRRRDPSALACLRVHMVGPLEPSDEARARAAQVFSVFEPFAPVPAFEATDFLHGQDLLLLSTERGRDEIIPAKLFDYLAAGRPVLSLCENPEVSELLARTGAGAQPADSEQAAALLQACVHAKREGRPLPVGGQVDAVALESFGAARKAAELAGLLEQLLAAQRD